MGHLDLSVRKYSFYDREWTEMNGNAFSFIDVHPRPFPVLYS